jgi:SAM-dependent methyltransferase
MKRKPEAKGYSSAAAEKFWSERVQSTDDLAAVLTYNARPEINQTYDAWEKGVLAAFLKQRKGITRALDIGAGVGRISLLLASKGIEVVALDNSPVMLDRIARAATKAKLARRITTVHSQSSNIPLPDRSCDLVVCFGLLEHLPELERKAMLTEAARVVSRSGRMLFVVNNHDNPLLKRKYSQVTQRPDGYFVTLVGLPWLETQGKRLGLKTRVLGANPSYAHVHYLLEPSFNPPISTVDLTGLCKAALKSDLNAPAANQLARRFASHFMVEIRPA